MKQLHAFGAEPGQAQQIEQSGWHRRDELLALGQGARLDQRRDLLRDAAPDSGEIGEVELLTCYELGDGVGVIGNRACGVAVRAHLERIARGDLEEIGDVTEEAGDLGVLHPGIFPSCGPSVQVIR